MISPMGLVPVVGGDSVGFELACGAHGDMLYVLWIASVIALFTLFYEIYLCALI